MEWLKELLKNAGVENVDELEGKISKELPKYFKPAKEFNEINEELKEILNKKIQLIQKKIKEQPQIEITYFIPDSKKEGGRYETICNTIQKIDMYTNEFVMLDGTRIDIDDIIDIRGNLFQKISF